MKKNGLLFMLKSLVFVPVIIPLLLMYGCNSDAKYYDGIKSSEEDIGGGYKRVTVVTDNYSFSFEYSTFYLKVGPETINPGWVEPGIEVSLRAPKAHVDLLVPANGQSVKTVTTSYIPANIAVSIYDSSLNNKKPSVNATYMLNRRLEGEATFDNFKLIERSLLTVSGIEGDYADWEVGWMNLFANKSREPPLEYHWQVLFDYKGVIWEIDAESFGPELRERTNADFNHVVETFKILN